MTVCRLHVRSATLKRAAFSVIDSFRLIIDLFLLCFSLASSVVLLSDCLTLKINPQKPFEMSGTAYPGTQTGRRRLESSLVCLFGRSPIHKCPKTPQRSQWRHEKREVRRRCPCSAELTIGRTDAVVSRIPAPRPRSRSETCQWTVTIEHLKDRQKCEKEVN